MVEDGHWYLIQVDAADSLYDSIMDSDEAKETLSGWADTVIDPLNPPAPVRRYLETVLRDVFNKDTLIEDRIHYPRQSLRAIAESFDEFTKPRMRDGFVMVDLRVVNLNGLVMIKLGEVERPTVKPDGW